MAVVWKGGEVAAALNARIRADAEHLAGNGVTPTLAILRIGENDGDIAYERGAEKRAAAVGVAVKKCLLPTGSTQEDVLSAIRALNADETVHGVLIFRPLPAGVDDNAVRAALDPKKDVDGITDASLASVFAGAGAGFAPCTAQACMELLQYYGAPLSGARAVVVGRSLVIGRPVAMLLMRQNATVTICHTRTRELPAVCREADILIAAAGSAAMLNADYVRPGQSVLDVGINFTPDGKMAGDVDFSAVEPIVSAVTPVPGGVGSVTTSVLMAHVVEAARRSVQ